jgi:hypothetical protein
MAFQDQLAAFDQLAGDSFASLQTTNFSLPGIPSVPNTAQNQQQATQNIPTGSMATGTSSNGLGFTIGNFVLGPIIAVVLGLILIAGAIYLSKDSDVGQTVQKHVAKLGAAKAAAEVAA